MKRYRIISYDFDTRATMLNEEIKEDWEEKVKEQWESNKAAIKEGIIAEYGSVRAFEKIENFKDIGANPMSIIAFHNKFFRQVRSAYVIGSYYAALTGACSLGERILNHLILRLRDYFKSSKEYKKIYSKDSFDNWDLAINTLESWGVLLPDVVTSFRELKEIRNFAIHFNPETDENDQEMALKSIKNLTDIIIGQFSGFGTQPWFIDGTLGTCYIKIDYEENPFVKEIVLPNCVKVGHLHQLENSSKGWLVKDVEQYADIEISDDRFRELANNRDKYDAHNNKIQPTAESVG